jgi:hypothetical protein
MSSINLINVLAIAGAIYVIQQHAGKEAKKEAYDNQVKHRPEMSDMGAGYAPDKEGYPLKRTDL